MLGGAHFPVQVLPGCLQKFSFLIPDYLSSPHAASNHAEGILRGYGGPTVIGDLMKDFSNGQA